MGVGHIGIINDGDMGRIHFVSSPLFMILVKDFSHERLHK